MRLADANVLLDFCGLTPERVARADSVVRLVGSVGDRLVVTETVIAEVLWVLAGQYGMDGESAVMLVEGLLSSEQFVAEDEVVSMRAFDIKRRHPRQDIVDCFLAARVVESSDAVVTHDRALQRLILDELDRKEQT